MDGLAYKGIPLGARFDELMLTGVTLDVTAGDLATPLATICVPAIEANAAAMRAYCAAQGLQLAPHAKTTLAADLVAVQMRSGAWALTAALPRQVALVWEYGCARVLLANEVTDSAAIDWLAGRLATDTRLSLFVYVDSARGVELLAEGIRRAGAPERPFDVLVELGHRGGRTGCRSVAEAAALARLVADAPGLRLAGVAGYEGTIGAVRQPPVVAAVDAFLGDLRDLAEQVINTGLIRAGDAIVTAGGSLFFDRVAAVLGVWARDFGPTVVLRSGCYLIHDHGLYADGTPAAAGVPGAPQFVPALSVWARVLSTPEVGLALLDAGRRDVSYDAGLPVPVQRYRNGDVLALAEAGARVEALSDQHAFLRHPEGLDIAPGDLVRLGISHPCTTIDHHRALFLVDGADRVIGAARTDF